MEESINHILNKDSKLQNLYEYPLSPANLNDIISLIADFKFSKNNPDVNIEDGVYQIIKSKLDHFSHEQKDTLFKEMMNKSYKFKESTDSINVLTKKSNELPFYQLIKFRLPKVIQLFIDQGYTPDSKEKQIMLDKGLYSKINYSSSSYAHEAPDAYLVFSSIKKELSKFSQGLINRNLNVIDDLFSTVKKEDILGFFEKEREKDLLTPYFYDSYARDIDDSSIVIKCIIKNDLNGIYALLKNDFTLNFKEYCLMYLPLLLDKKDFKIEKNFPEFYKNREFIIQKLNTYPKEYKKELSLNIMREVNTIRNSSDADILFSLKDIIISPFADFNEKEKFEFIKLRNTPVFSLFIGMLNDEDRNFFIKLFNRKEIEFPGIFLKNIYSKIKQETFYKEEYERLFISKLDTYSIEEKQHVVDIIRSEKLQESEEKKAINIELACIIERDILSENITPKQQSNLKTKRL